MDAQLTVKAGPNEGQVFTLREGEPLVVGRSRQTVTQLSDPRVSRKHCQLSTRRGLVVLTDLGSVGGTFVNGERVQEKPLRSGDLIRIGDTVLLLHCADPAEQATVPPDVDAEATLPPAPFPAPPPAPRPAPPLRPPTLPLRPPDPPFAAPPDRRLQPAAKQAAPESAPPKKKTQRPAVVPAQPSEKRPVALPANRLGELTNTMLTHFRLGKVLAKGQSGLVFEAEDIRQKRKAAVKVLWPDFSLHDNEVRRFVRSMRTMMPLHHRNLVSIWGAGKKGPYCWVAMEHVAGESLHQMIQHKGAAGMLDWRHAFRIATHLGRGLEFAHEHRIIHRNITPRNVLIRAVDHIALLGDLMLGRALEGTLAEQLTKPGEMLGDVRFMSPERHVGDGRRG